MPSQIGDVETSIGSLAQNTTASLAAVPLAVRRNRCYWRSNSYPRGLAKLWKTSIPSRPPLLQPAHIFLYSKNDLIRSLLQLAVGDKPLLPDIHELSSHIDGIAADLTSIKSATTSSFLQFQKLLAKVALQTGDNPLFSEIK